MVNISDGGVKRFNKQTPCHVCGSGTKGCSQTEDGLCRCRGRRKDEPAPGFFWLGQSKDGVWEFWRGENDREYRKPYLPLKRGRGRPKKAEAAPAPAGDDEFTPADLTASAGRYRRNGERLGAIRELAADLGVAESALAALKIGFRATPVWAGNLCERTLPEWTTPECDASGRVIGIGRRRWDGGKGLVGGGHRGLVFRPDLFASPMPEGAPLFLPEGMSDVAALLTVGLEAVGRPSNMGGVDHLAALLLDAAARRKIGKGNPVIVLGENDKAGREGAECVALPACNRPSGDTCASIWRSRRTGRRTPRVVSVKKTGRRVGRRRVQDNYTRKKSVPQDSYKGEGYKGGDGSDGIYTIFFGTDFVLISY
jgi:hypothetical protein